jgi:hypothetical protein
LRWCRFRLVIIALAITVAIAVVDVLVRFIIINFAAAIVFATATSIANATATATATATDDVGVGVGVGVNFNDWKVIDIRHEAVQLFQPLAVVSQTAVARACKSASARCAHANVQSVAPFQSEETGHTLVRRQRRLE